MAATGQQYFESAACIGIPPEHPHTNRDGLPISWMPPTPKDVYSLLSLLSHTPSPSLAPGALAMRPINERFRTDESRSSAASQDHLFDRTQVSNTDNTSSDTTISPLDTLGSANHSLFWDPPRHGALPHSEANEQFHSNQNSSEYNTSSGPSGYESSNSVSSAKTNGASTREQRTRKWSVTRTEDEKRKDFLARNREAANRCRQRQKDTMESLQTRADVLKEKNAQLQQEITGLMDNLIRMGAVITKSILRKEEANEAHTIINNEMERAQRGEGYNLRKRVV